MAETQRASASDVAMLKRRASRRLLGAAVLMLLAILTVPLLLEREPPPLPETVEVRIPPVEGTAFEHKLDGTREGKGAPRTSADPAVKEERSEDKPAAVALGPSSPSAASPSQVPPAKASPGATPAERLPSEAPNPPAQPRESSAPAPAARTDTPAAAGASAAQATPPRRAGQFVVQIIAVRDAAAAKAVADRARGLKYPVYTEKIDVANGVVTRVRVGPYDTKQAAEAARARLARDGFETRVVALQ
ncbi:MAG: SPOR domain-containing protein [Casimicrobiaceae bacterium]|nr:SPOR domain-containing protein [Casimicrobiaceae bacterium]MCX8098082.1 SPOR domain-containing protein [Casimicrobiaceae bacterium]MDW8313103.1 SPOR domain-containing protein [Burkholderiales bacterium]